MVDYPDLINLSRDELLEEYCKLFDRFQDLRGSNEADTQKIYELKRSLDTAIAAQAYLSQELEQYTNSNNDENELHKVQAELVEVKRKYGNVEESLASLQQDYSLLLEKNSKLTQDLEANIKQNEQTTNEVDEKLLDEYILRIQTLENENMDLLQKIHDFEESSVRYTLTIAESEKKLEILQDQIMCLKENLQSKRSELDEKLQILESTQEHLVEANAKIAILSTAPDNDDRKGNSLFAEVDDQRQAMKQLLMAQKKSYMQMKKIYNEREHEIRRLKRENISMHTELAACSSIFCNADKIYQEKLNERIRHLLNQNEDLECKLKWTQERLKELANGKGVLFLDSMLNFCKKETDDLKVQLHSVRIQRASLEEQLRNAQQDIARWRFESLKSRCILIDRENLLTENNIPFKPIHAMEFNISDKDQENAKPRIVTGRRSNILENVIDRVTTTPSKVLIKKEIRSPPQNLIKENSILNNIDFEKEPKEYVNNETDILTGNEQTLSEKESCTTEMQAITYEDIKPTVLNKVELSESLNMPTIKKHNNQDKENKCNINISDDIPEISGFAKLKVKPPSPMRPSQRSLEKSTLKTSGLLARSILSKPNDLIFKDSCKNVKFSSDGDTVYNLSLDTSSSTSTTVSLKTNTKLNSKSTIKQSPTKSNVVVRRVVVSSKHD